MTTPSGAYVACHCGHVQGHHAVVDYLFGARMPYCEWRGCGCPRFLPPDDNTLCIGCGWRNGAHGDECVASASTPSSSVDT